MDDSQNELIIEAVELTFGIYYASIAVLAFLIYDTGTDFSSFIVRVVMLILSQ